MANNVRELTEKEVRGIRRLVVERCANYHEDYGCLPLDCNCVMLEKVPWRRTSLWQGIFCWSIL